MSRLSTAAFSLTSPNPAVETRPTEFARGILYRLAASVLLALATGTSDAHACDPPAYGHYGRVTIREVVAVTDTKVLTLYDHCGRHYEVEKTVVRTVLVPIKKRVFVSD